MQLYVGKAADFVRDSVQSSLAERLGDIFYDYYGHHVSPSELNSWRNSLTALSAHLQFARLRDQGVILEMQLPLTSARLDCMLTGRDPNDSDNALLIELKQWAAATPSDWDDCVQAVVGGGERPLLHPSVQAAQYVTWLEDTSEAFYTDPRLYLSACSWLHNMTADNAGALRASKFQAVLSKTPLFVASDGPAFLEYMRNHVGMGKGMPILERVTSARHAPSKKLMVHTAEVIRGEPVYTLLDDQLVAYQAILATIRKALKRGEKHVVILSGGPGTGKSVLALNIMATLLRMGINAQHVTGSKAFTETLWKTIGSRSKPQFRYSHHYTRVDADHVDVLIMDEAHRLRASSNNRWTSKALRTNKSQVDELIDAAKVAVFFIDDDQVVRPSEVGSTQLIREAAVLKQIPVTESALETQFRCAGCDHYVAWIDQLLEVRKTGATRLGDTDDFEFRLVDCPQELDQIIRAKAAIGMSARITAGFCWPWSNPNPDGTLVDDVRIGTFARPWDAKPDARKLAKGIPRAQFWATDPAGIEQVGCIYTAQGFEFDYAGVIMSFDLVIRNGIWVGQPAQSHDPIRRSRSGAPFTECVKNAYRVLLTRGMKGCFVYVQDAETRRYVESRL